MINLSTISWSPYTEPSKTFKQEGPPSLSVLAKSLVGFAFSLVLALGIVGNSSVCYIILKDLKLTVTNLFLFNLSLSDILMGIFAGPFVMLNDFIIGYWPFGIVMCKLMPIMQGVSSFVSALTHVVISFDRFVVVYKPLKPRIRQRSAMYILLSIWISSALIMIPLPIIYQVKLAKNVTYCLEDWNIFIFNNYTEDVRLEKATFYNTLYTILLMIMQYFLPLFVIISTYSAIAVRIWIRETPGEVDQKRDQRIAKSKKKLLKMVIIVALLYGLNHLPRHAFFLATLQNSEIWETAYSHYLLYTWIFCILAEQSSMGFNPLIYCWMNKQFRHGFIRICWIFLPCCVERIYCSIPSLETHRSRTERNTYCASSNYEKPMVSPRNKKKPPALNSLFSGNPNEQTKVQDEK